MIKIYIDSIRLFEQGKEISAELELPADKVALDKAFEEAHIQGIDDCEMFDASCDIPQIQKAVDRFELPQNSIHEMNLFAQRLTAMDETAMERFKAGLILRTPDTLKDAVNLTANLGSINVLPDICTEKELGGHLVDIGVYEFDADVLPYIDYALVGAEYLSENTAALTEMGFIEDYPTEHQRIVIYDGVNLPDSYKLEMPANEHHKNIPKKNIKYISEYIKINTENGRESSQKAPQSLKGLRRFLLRQKSF